MSEKRKKRVLLGVTGSVAAVKAPEVAVKIASFAEVKVLLTVGGRNFWNKADSYNPTVWQVFQDNYRKRSIEIIDPDDEWKTWHKLGDSVEHIDLRNWADLLVIAPLSAHTLAKLSNGLCDDTLSCVARAWKFDAVSSSPLLVAPAMNTAMWDHPITQEQVQKIQSWGVSIINPQSKLLACGELGMGALAPVDDIILAVRKGLDDDLKVESGKDFVVTSVSNSQH